MGGAIINCSGSLISCWSGRREASRLYNTNHFLFGLIFNTRCILSDFCVVEQLVPDQCITYGDDEDSDKDNDNQ